MKFLLIVNNAPWDGTLGLVARRLASAVAQQGHELCAVFFRGEGVYTALAAGQVDAGAIDLHKAWREFAAEQHTPLLLCSTDLRRRMHMPGDTGFRSAGLPEVVALMAESDRVISL